MLDNVHAFCHDKQAVFNEVVRLEWVNSTLTIYGRGRYTASREKREVLISAATPREKVGHFPMHIGDTKEVASALKKVEGAGRAGTVVTFSVDGEGSLRIYTGAEELAILDDADPDGETLADGDTPSLWEEIDLAIERQENLSTEGLAFTRDLLQRVGKIRAGKPNQPYDVWDFTMLRGRNTVGVKFGPNWVGLLEAVWRPGYEQGGLYKDGPGEPGSLW